MVNVSVADRSIWNLDPADDIRRHGAALQLLGGFALSINGQPVQLAESGQRLLALLALAPRPQDRRLVACRLWPDKVDERASANLRGTIWRMPPLTRGEVVVSDGARLSLNEQILVDTREVEQMGWTLVRQPDMSPADIDCSRFDADLLPGWYDDWVVQERERLAQLQLHFQEALAYALLHRGRVAEALDAALRLVAIDPLRERSQRLLLTVYCSEGSLGQAERQLERYRSELEEAFGCAPSISIGRIMLELEAATRPVSLLPDRS